MSELNLTKKSESFSEMEVRQPEGKIFPYTYGSQRRVHLHFETRVWPVVTSEEWEGENDAGKISAGSDRTE